MRGVTVVGNITSADLVVIGVYLTLLLAVAVFFAHQRPSGVHYFLAGRHVGWLAIGASLFAANAANEQVALLASSESSYGALLAQLGWLAYLGLLLLGWVFVPLYLRSGVSTMPEFLERRYGKSSQIFLTTVSIVAYMLTKVSVTIFAGSLLLKQIVGWGGASSAVTMVVIAGLYAVAGGLRTIVYVDIVQAGVLLLGAAALALRGSLSFQLGFLSMKASEFHVSWTSMLLGAPVLAVWYWCTEQYVVQRTLSGRNTDHVRSGVILAGFLKVVAVLIVLHPGRVAGNLGVDQALASGPYPVATAGLSGPGTTGIIIAGFLAALTSSLACSFNSSSALFTMDLYRQFRPQASERELVLAGRLTTTVLVLLAILWVPLLRYMSMQICLYLQAIHACMAPPIAAVFVLGILWPRVSATGAIVSLCTGAALGALRFVLELLEKAGRLHCVVLQHVARINFFDFTALLFLVSAGILVAISLVSARPQANRSNELSVALRRAAASHGGRRTSECSLSWQRANLTLSLLLLASVLLLFFRPL
ncbi:MAG: sodium:solute symporter family transporter [Candidatus Oleimicrobiaceae bacterium]